MSSLESKREFCVEHVNELNQEGREAVFNILRMYVREQDIDSSNTDGSRMWLTHIPEACIERMYTAISSWLEA